MMGSKIHIAHLITQDSLLIIHIPKNERYVAEIPIAYTAVFENNK
jgi:hypothetical protein